MIEFDVFGTNMAKSQLHCYCMFLSEEELLQQQTSTKSKAKKKVFKSPNPIWLRRPSLTTAANTTIYKKILVGVVIMCFVIALQIK